MKIVVHTTVFISGVFFAGAPYQILKAWGNGRIQILISKEILDEYRRAGDLLAEKFFGIELVPILQLLAINAELVQPQKLQRPVCDTPYDDKFLACALAGKSTIIISDHKHLMKVSGYKGIQVIRPPKFVAEYLKK